MTTKPPTLLNEDGSASMATMLMMSHHGLRRDLAQFAIALRRVTDGNAPNVAALQDEWRNYRNTLHGHHSMEDARIFPQLRSEHASVAPVIDRLASEHRRIDPVLEHGDRAFAELPASLARAVAVVCELRALLEPHLATEEAQMIPFLRAAREFQAPTSNAELALYADGFAWSSHGVAPEVLEQVYALLPEQLTAQLPAARAAFAQRCARVWGTAEAGASRTAVPDWL